MFISALYVIKCSLNPNESVHVISVGGGEKLDSILDVYASMKMKRIIVFIGEIMMCVE